MTSPTCQVRDGAGPFEPTTDGVDVTPGNTITIRLVSDANVRSWSIECIGTDELSDRAAVNDSIERDPLAKTATFTAPEAGRAYVFLSRVDGGVNIDGTPKAEYATTFEVHTPTALGDRVLAVNETTEANALFGWIAKINPRIRNPGGGAMPGGSEGDAQWNDGAGGLTATPTIGRVKPATLVADADPYVKPWAGVGHRTTTNGSTTAPVEVGPTLEDATGVRVDVLVTASARVGGVLCMATFTLSATFGRDDDNGGLVWWTGGTDPDPVIPAALAGVSAELDFTVEGAPAILLVGKAGTRITWGWEARSQVQALEPA